MKTEIKMLKFLMDHRDGATLREIAMGSWIDYRIAHIAMESLGKKGLIEKRKLGGSWHIVLSNKMTPEIFEAEYERREKFLEKKDFRIMLGMIMERMKTRNFVLLLFGSHAKGTATKHSDIDIMFIIPDEKMEGMAESAARATPLNVHATIVTEEQFVGMKKSKEYTVGGEAMKNNIILYGIEQYYEMIR